MRIHTQTRIRNLVFAVCLLIVGFLLFPQIAQAATLYLTPQSGTITVGNSFNVALIVNTQGVAINSAEATVRFPTDKVEVTALTKGDVFTLWAVEPSYSNSTGRVTFAGGRPNPGYTGLAGRILTISFRAKAEGTASVTITDGRVLANDGQGTNVLTSQGSGTYILAAGSPPEPEKNLPPAPAVSSPTHPNASEWYAHDAPVFEWTRPTGVLGFSFSFDDQESTIPDAIEDTTQLTTSFADIADGVWYFHVRSRNTDGWGPAGTLRVRIDTTAPEPFTIFGTLDAGAPPSEARQVSFETTDVPSGVHHYDIQIDGGEVTSIDVGATTPYTLPQLAVGSHAIRVRAFDYAGNSRLATAEIVIGTPSTLPTNQEAPSLPTLQTLAPLTALIPQPILDLADSLIEPLNRLRDNEPLAQVVDEILEPANTAAVALAAVGLATTATSFELTNILYLLFRFGYFWLVPLNYGKKRKPWGVVFDSTTGRPVKNAVVRIFAKEFNKMKESQLTDAQGRFGFLVDIGEYYVTATHPGYVFPSRLLQTEIISRYQHIYRGDTFTIRDRVEGALQMNIPIDPDLSLTSQGRVRWLRFLNVVGLILERMNVPLLIGGTIISWITLIFLPEPLNYLILLLYVVLIIFKWRLSKRVRRSWGDVRDAAGRTPIELAVIRIHDMATGRVVSTRITNRQGRFSALVLPGKYYLIVTHPMYTSYQSQPIVVKRRQGIITTSIRLTRRDAGRVGTPVPPQQTP